jgi:hypothetical protein
VRGRVVGVEDNSDANLGTTVHVSFVRIVTASIAMMRRENSQKSVRRSIIGPSLELSAVSRNTVGSIGKSVNGKGDSPTYVPYSDCTVPGLLPMMVSSVLRITERNSFFVL